jgi:predicted DCC family thiol-disulfide oxidoreductase YuxK
MKILFFDGVCSLCNELVDFALAQKSSEKILFSPLQGETASKMLKKPNEDSVLFLDEDKLYQKSEAIFRLMQYWPKPFPLGARIGLKAPKKITDSVYDWVAKNRLRLFGVKAQCRLPSEEEKSHFLP